MKVLPFKFPKVENVGLVFKLYGGEKFYSYLHEHQEIQISYIDSGEGTLFVGNTFTEYKKGDIFVIGSNIPHLFKSDLQVKERSKMLTLFFHNKSFGESFFDLVEMNKLKSFFEKSYNGCKVLSNKEKITLLIQKIEYAEEFDRFIAFMEILSLISESETKPISNFVYPKSYNNNEGQRMTDILEYTMNNFNEIISLKEIASVANMTSNAFCRYFKQRTNKTYFDFLIEIRIENACSNLSKKDLTIAQVAENSGFKNTSNFNRKFKKIKGITPSAYRKML